MKIDILLEQLLSDRIIDREYLKLAYEVLKFPNHFEKIEELENLKKFLEKRISTINKNSKEYLFENDKIFMIDILNGNVLNGLVQYFRRIFPIMDVTYLIELNYIEFFKNFFNGFNSTFLKSFFNNILNLKEIERLSFYDFRNCLNWIWQIFNILKIPEKQKIDLVFEELKIILKYLIKKDRLSDVLFTEMMVYSMFIHSVEDMYNDFIKLEREICKPCQNYYLEWVERNKLPPCKKEITKQGKIKLAFIRPVITFWSPFKLEYSFIKKLLEDKTFSEKHEVYFYTMNMEDLGGEKTEKICINFLKQLNIKVRSPVSHYKRFVHYCDYAKKVLEFREKLIRDNIDIVIYSDHFYSVGEFLFISRVAPKQIYWAHMNTVVDFKGIDKKIIHFPPPKECEKDFELFDIELDSIFFEGEKERWKKEAEGIRKRFPEGTIILGAIGRMVKVDNWDYLKTVAEILKQNPDTVYLACGPGETNGIKEKIEKLGIANRFYFEGWVDPKIYAFVIDVYLNTFPNWSGEVVKEYLKLRPEGCVVTLER